MLDPRFYFDNVFYGLGTVFSQGSNDLSDSEIALHVKNLLEQLNEKISELKNEYSELPNENIIMSLHMLQHYKAVLEICRDYVSREGARYDKMRQNLDGYLADAINPTRKPPAVFLDGLIKEINKTMQQQDDDVVETINYLSVAMMMVGVLLAFTSSTGFGISLAVIGYLIGAYMNIANSNPRQAELSQFAGVDYTNTSPEKYKYSFFPATVIHYKDADTKQDIKPAWDYSANSLSWR